VHSISGDMAMVHRHPSGEIAGYKPQRRRATITSTQLCLHAYRDIWMRTLTTKGSANRQPYRVNAPQAGYVAHVCHPIPSLVQVGSNCVVCE
jgi:hypothetical protein